MIDKEAPKLQDAKEPGPSAFTTTRSGEMIFKSSSIIGLVNLMANILQTPVVDGTGIKGLYDFSLDPMRLRCRQAIGLAMDSIVRRPSSWQARTAWF